MASTVEYKWNGEDSEFHCWIYADVKRGEGAEINVNVIIFPQTLVKPGPINVKTIAEQEII